LLPDEACNQVGWAARRERHDDADRAVRIVAGRLRNGGRPCRKSEEGGSRGAQHEDLRARQPAPPLTRSRRRSSGGGQESAGIPSLIWISRTAERLLSPSTPSMRPTS